MNGIGVPTITLYEPWATWVAWGWKYVETRGHSHFKGLMGTRIGIHAGRTFDENWPEIAGPYLSAEQWGMMRESEAKPGRGMHHGQIVCTTFVTEARWLRAGDSMLALCDCSQGDRFGLVFEKIRPQRRKVYARGQRGIWEFVGALN